MTQEEIRKLLGGYATNALSADERRILFEAALEDQNLYNALQNEDALKELLDDPVLRDQVRSALATPARVTHHAGFSWRRWAFGVAIPAVAAVIIIVVMNRARAPEQISQPAQMARIEPKQVPAAPEATPPVAKKQLTSPSAHSAPTTPAPIQLDSARRADASATGSLRDETAPSKSGAVASPQAGRVQPEMAQGNNAPVASFRAASASLVIPEAARQLLSAGVAANAPLYQGPLVQYSVARGRYDGNAVRVNVTLAIAGYLALYRVDTAGNFTRVYPANGEATHALPNIAMQIPIDPVKVDAGEKLRLVLIPAGPGGVVGQLAGGVGGALPSPASPLVVDIPIGPN